MLYDVTRISFCPSRYWPTVAVASSRGGALEYRASLVRVSFVRSTRRQLPHSNMPGRAAWYSRTRTAVPVGAPTAVDILASFPPVRGLVCWQHRLRGSREVGVLLAQAASSSSAQRQMWRSLGARSILLDARSFMISTLRSHCALRSASPRPLRMHASASRVSSSSGALAARAPAGRYASAARAFISPTAFEQARGGALGAGGGRVGFAGGGLFMGLF